MTVRFRGVPVRGSSKRALPIWFGTAVGLACCVRVLRGDEIQQQLWEQHIAIQSKLMGESQVVAFGSVSAVDSTWTSSGGAIFARYRMVVDGLIAGQAFVTDTSSLSFVGFTGDMAKGSHIRTPFAPTIGERYLVLLSGTLENQNRRLTGPLNHLVGDSIWVTDLAAWTSWPAYRDTIESLAERRSLSNEEADAEACVTAVLTDPGLSIEGHERDQIIDIRILSVHYAPARVGMAEGDLLSVRTGESSGISFGCCPAIAFGDTIIAFLDRDSLWTLSPSVSGAWVLGADGYDVFVTTLRQQRPRSRYSVLHRTFTEMTDFIQNHTP